MIKKIVLGLVAMGVLFVAAVVAAVILIPTHCQVEREVTIDKPREEVFNYVKKLKAQNDWGP